jgi:hypothetical protein
MLAVASFCGVARRWRSGLGGRSAIARPRQSGTFLEVREAPRRACERLSNKGGSPLRGPSSWSAPRVFGGTENAVWSVEWPSLGRTVACTAVIDRRLLVQHHRQRLGHHLLRTRHRLQQPAARLLAVSRWLDHQCPRTVVEFRRGDKDGNQAVRLVLALVARDDLGGVVVGLGTVLDLDHQLRDQVAQQSHELSARSVESRSARRAVSAFPMPVGGTARGGGSEHYGRSFGHNSIFLLGVRDILVSADR